MYESKSCMARRHASSACSCFYQTKYRCDADHDTSPIFVPVKHVPTGEGGLKRSLVPGALLWINGTAPAQV